MNERIRDDSVAPEEQQHGPTQDETVGGEPDQILVKAMEDLYNNINSDALSTDGVSDTKFCALLDLRNGEDGVDADALKEKLDEAQREQAANVQLIGELESFIRARIEDVTAIRLYVEVLCKTKSGISDEDLAIGQQSALLLDGLNSIRDKIFRLHQDYKSLMDEISEAHPYLTDGYAGTKDNVYQNNNAPERLELLHLRYVYLGLDAKLGEIRGMIDGLIANSELDQSTYEE